MSTENQVRKNLPGVWRLIVSSWGLFLPQAKFFMSLSLIGILSVFFAAGVGGLSAYYYFVTLKGAPSLLAIISFVLLALLLIGIVCFLQLWLGVALILSLHEKKFDDLKYVLVKSKSLLGRYFLVGLLNFLTVVGGFILFIVPGVIFSIWYMFAMIISITEDKKGWNAMVASKMYVKGRWWAVVWRLIAGTLLISLCSFLMSLILGQLVDLLPGVWVSMIIGFALQIPMQMAAGICISIFTFLLYRALVESHQAGSVETEVVTSLPEAV